MAIDSPVMPLHDVTQACSTADALLVLPILAAEREAWNRLMDRHHCLGFRVIVGESLRYVALLGDSLAGLGCRSLQEPSSGRMDRLGGTP
jgi:hypothetical protein